MSPRARLVAAEDPSDADPATDILRERMIALADIYVLTNRIREAARARALARRRAELSGATREQIERAYLGAGEKARQQAAMNWGKRQEGR
jgi:hypothetical protein